MDERDEQCCFAEWAAADARRARAGKRVEGVSRDLVDALDALGWRGRTVLDLGCGAGGLAIEAVARGAARVTGIDLSDAAIETARVLSEESGTGDRTSFIAGDASVAPLERHDVVILNRVFCCYPTVEGLLENSIGATGWAYAMTVPPSSGWRGIVARAMVGIENVWTRVVHRSRFRAFVHDVGRIDQAVLDAGFRTVVSRRRRGWDLRIYARAAEATRP
jgi:magnesium-protoporphyrin O-methyltransferase